MPREGGSYIIQEDGTRKLVQRTLPPQPKQQQQAKKPAKSKSEVNTHVDTE